MGRENDIMLSFLNDNERFADLFNAFYFGGKVVIKPEELEEASEVYHEWEVNETGSVESHQWIRDLKKRLKNGKELKILAIEDQALVSYIMPWRCMNYDNQEYETQIKRIQKVNEKQNTYKNAAERMCQFHKEDRLAPTYTICLYHGEAPWDGPHSLKDMMEFGDDEEDWKELFADYPMRLLCVNEITDYSCFHSSLKELFQLLHYRKDKKGLLTVLEEKPEYKKMDRETAMTISILTGVDGVMDYLEEFRKKESKYNMCQAIREIREDAFIDGVSEGLDKGLKEGNILMLISLVDKKIKKNMQAEEIAEWLEQDVQQVNEICMLIQKHPDWTDKEIYQELHDKLSFHLS